MTGISYPDWEQARANTAQRERIIELEAIVRMKDADISRLTAELEESRDAVRWWAGVER